MAPEPVTYYWKCCRCLQSWDWAVHTICTSCHHVRCNTCTVTTHYTLDHPPTLNLKKPKQLPTIQTREGINLNQRITMDEPDGTDPNRSPFASDDNPSTTEQHNTESGKAESNVNQTVKTHLRLPLELREIVYCCAIRQECVELSHTHFENYSGFMPRVDAKILVFESASFPGAPVLNGWDRTDQAHGNYTNAHDHVEDWVDAVLNVSTDKGIELHFCRPWRNFGYLSGVAAPLRDAGYDLSVTWDEINCLQVPDQFSSFLMAMTARSITREQLDDTNLQLQSNLSEDTAWILIHYGTGATLLQAFDPTGKGEISWEQRKIPAMK
ncbi:hypothetical protein FOC1_g10012078 [Fusarium oxysporum f. sp. cubense race 1]|uniref:Uncharacterized protein n=1 Tax=Fusarium oxysporum f. sp. cubense (strain race 1) TaxID=1229664 RepID=N4UI62_FUSC1|nr:hypothetical protein FOC1_g10012078 [Fusarium oxysporum f. sp. cubense race 1]